jgi:hypothetical protein
MARKTWYISKDTLWKGVIHELFPEFWTFYLPDYADLLDFSKKPVFLDKELAEINPESDSGENRADMLVKVFLKDGTDKWLFIHIEIQGYEDNKFEQRMFTYYYRIWDKYQVPIAAVAIFTDGKEDFFPKKYETTTFNTSLSYQFHAVKILKMKEMDLDRSNNPFAIVTEVVLMAIEKKKEKEETLLELKTELFRKLLKKGFDKNYIRLLANFLEYYQIFRNFDLHLQLKKNMDKISTLVSNPYPQTMEGFILLDIERQCIKQGIEQGKEQGIEQGIEKGLEIAALNMLKHTVMSVEEIAQLSGLPKERILALKKALKQDKYPKYMSKVITETKTFFQKVKQYWTKFWNK